MTAPPPDDPDGPGDPRERSDLDFDAEFERMVADWGPTPDPSTETPASSGESPAASNEPPAASVEPVETPDKSDDSLRNLFRGAWPDEQASDRDASDPDEHYVPPPAPPLPRPEPRRLIAWAGLLGAPLVGLLFLVLGALPTYVSFLLFCWFVGGFAYLVATMNDRGGDGWDDGARV